MEPKGFFLSGLRTAGSAVTKRREQHNEVLELGGAIAVHIASRRAPCRKQGNDVGKARLAVAIKVGGAGGSTSRGTAFATHKDASAGEADRLIQRHASFSDATRQIHEAGDVSAFGPKSLEGASTDFTVAGGGLEAISVGRAAGTGWGAIGELA